MGARTEYAPGTFCWTDLGTTDVDGAKAFYTGLFGWEADDMPVGDGDFTYTMFRLGDKYVSAAYPQQAQGAPPNWLSYVSADDIDAKAATAKELGATLISEPFDVLDVGRQAVVQDPTGAVFALWEPRRHIGAALVNDVGAMGWNDLRTGDVPAAKSFYGDLFGWTFEGGDQIPYTTFKNGETMNGGVMEIQPEWGDVPPHWAPYFTVANCDASIVKAKELGGQVIAPPMDVPVGRFAGIADPQGAVFSIFQGEVDP